MTTKESCRAYLEEIKDYSKGLYEADRLEYTEEDVETLRDIWNKMLNLYLKKIVRDT